MKKYSLIKKKKERFYTKINKIVHSINIYNLFIINLINKIKFQVGLLDKVYFWVKWKDKLTEDKK